MLKTFRARLLIYSSLDNLCARRDFLRHSLNSRVCFKAKTPSRERQQSSQQNITGTQLGRWNLVVESQRVRRVERKERESGMINATGIYTITEDHDPVSQCTVSPHQTSSDRTTPHYSNYHANNIYWNTSNSERAL